MKSTVQFTEIMYFIYFTWMLRKHVWLLYSRVQVSDNYSGPEYASISVILFEWLACVFNMDVMALRKRETDALCTTPLKQRYVKRMVYLSQLRYILYTKF